MYRVQDRRRFPGTLSLVGAAGPIGPSNSSAQEVGMIKSSPNKIITEAAEWRFLNELRYDMKG